MKRSDVLKMAATLPFLTNVLSSQEKEENPPPKSNPEGDKTALILGAGLSGLYIAYKLKEKGYAVKILEAEKNPGGRIRSLKIGKSEVTAQLGAEWISPGDTEIIKLVTKLGLTLGEVPYAPHLEGITSDEMKEIHFSGTGRTAFKKILNLYKTMPAQQKKGLDKAGFYNYMKYQEMENRDIEAMESLYSLYFGESLRFISADFALGRILAKPTPPDKLYYVKEGTNTIPEKLLELIGKTSLFAGEPVTHVNQENNQIVVRTSGGRIHTASLCISTVPSLCLLDIRFSPDLPREKKLASLQIQFAPATKTFLFAAEKIQGPQETIYSASALSPMLYRKSIKSSGEENLQMLSIMEAGGSCSLYQNLPVDHLKSGYESSLQRFFSLPNLKFSDDFHSETWSQSKWIPGAHSFNPPGAMDARENLRKPFGRIYFAGESVMDAPSSMNTALLSAESILGKI